MPAKTAARKAANANKVWKKDVPQVREVDIMELWAEAYLGLQDGRVGRWRPIVQKLENPQFKFEKAHRAAAKTHSKKSHKRTR